MKTKTALSREGVYFLFVTSIFMIGSIMREVNPMLLLAAALFAVMPTAGWVGRYSLRGVKVQRKLPDRVFVGEPFIVHVELSKQLNNFRYNNSDANFNSESKVESELSTQFDIDNKNNNLDGKKKLSNRNSKKIKRRRKANAGSWAIVVSDKIQSVNNEDNVENLTELMPYEPAIYFEFIEAGNVVHKTYAGKLPQRGQYKFGPVTISTRFPFGFFRHAFCQLEDNGDDEFYVYPKIGRLSAKWRIRRSEAAINRQRYRFRPNRGTGEFLGVRRWLSGDAKKWIHWRASVKHGQPFVRQFETKQNYDCAVLLDIYGDRLVDSDRVGIENFELAVSFAATLVSEMTRRGGCNLFFATSKPDEENLSGPICLPLVENVLRRLATTKCESKDNLPRVIIEALAQIDPGADIILISPKPLSLINSPRFNSIRNDPRFRTAIQRIKLVDTSNKEFDQYFSLQ
ncbi:MAG: DUF58 domain-containing protein [Planctomycetaceae bacterium]|jgi:hypothetical protein|nr:DUF58 domain-containing protein [Planctomycetaceae bacterium]